MMTSEETTIVFGPNSESGAASLTKSRQKKGEALSMITCKHAHELQLPSQSMARCDMLFAHFLPAAKNSLVTRENIKEEIVEWIGRLLSEISFGSDPVDTPILDVTPGDKSNEVNLFLLWLQPIKSEVCIRTAEYLEKKYLELGGSY